MNCFQGNADGFKPWLLNVVPNSKFFFEIFVLHHESAGKWKLSGENEMGVIVRTLVQRGTKICEVLCSNQSKPSWYVLRTQWPIQRTWSKPSKLSWISALVPSQDARKLCGNLHLVSPPLCQVSQRTISVRLCPFRWLIPNTFATSGWFHPANHRPLKRRDHHQKKLWQVDVPLSMLFCNSLCCLLLKCGRCCWILFSALSKLYSACGMLSCPFFVASWMSLLTTWHRLEVPSAQAQAYFFTLSTVFTHWNCFTFVSTVSWSARG